MDITQRFKQKQAWNENPLFSSIFFLKKKKFPVFVHYFTLIEPQPTFKTAELLRTNLDWIQTPPRYCEGNNERLQIGRNYCEGKKEGKGLGEEMRLVTIWWEAV